MMDNMENAQSSYDPRWFIWTIVFLVSTGVMLVTYIVTSSDNNDVVVEFPVSAHAKNIK